MQNIVIVKYNAGNIGSVGNALNRLQVRFKISDHPKEIQSADKVIFPGVGEASTTMAYLNNNGLADVIKNLTQPVLGICLGMQLMCASSDEGQTLGMGIFPEKVKRFMIKEKVPHMGWNAVRFKGSGLFSGLEHEPWYYFVHSYYAEIGPSCAGVTRYGLDFASCLQKDNYYATQFHPEKSSLEGQLLLEKFVAL